MLIILFHFENYSFIFIKTNYELLYDIWNKLEHYIHQQIASMYKNNWLTITTTNKPYCPSYKYKTNGCKIVMQNLQIITILINDQGSRIHWEILPGSRIVDGRLCSSFLYKFVYLRLKTETLKLIIINIFCQ